MDNSSFITQTVNFLKTLSPKQLPMYIYAFYERYGLFVTLVVLYFFIAWAFMMIKMKGWWFKKNIKNQHIFITGAGSGIGREMSTLLAKKGSRITVTDINLESATETANMIKSSGGEAHAIKLDVTDFDDIKKAHASAKEKYGVIDILINNAGVTIGKLINI